ncbi:MAG: hypothetical protein J2P51_01335, partial [Hyphomicrobiaceae bacterium]|nr:hypothetical protein [Hyphomicrobiaceae bacterium]
QYANIAFNFEEGGAPRQCQPGAGSDIKIAFEDNKGWWSVPGTSSRTQDPSMNLQFYGVDAPKLADGQPAPEAVMRATILHEFGHALGLLHEHQSPTANCDVEIDWDAAYKIGAEIGWDKMQVDRNFRQLTMNSSLNATKVDRKSIMHYSLPPNLFKRGKQSPCFVTENLELSEQDRTFIASIYPKAEVPIVVSSAPPTAVVRGGAKRPPPSDDPQTLVERYAELLKQSGVAADRSGTLVAEFRKAVLGQEWGQ